MRPRPVPPLAAFIALALGVLGGWALLSDIVISTAVAGRPAALGVMVLDGLAVLAATAALSLAARATLARSRAAQRRAEDQARKLSLHLAAGRALADAGTEAELFGMFCRALTAEGAAMAWVGLAGPDGTIEVVAREGHAQGYLDGIEVRWEPGHVLASGPVGRALNERRTHVVADALTDPMTAPWRDRLEAWGLRGCVGVPLAAEGRCLGVLAVYWAAPLGPRFAPALVLEPIADDLARGMLAIRRRREAEAATNRVLRALDASPSPMLLIGPQGTIAYANPAAADAFGYAPAEFVGLEAAALAPAWLAATRRQQVASLLASPHTVRLGDNRGVPARRRDGSTFPADVCVGPVEIDGEPHLVCTIVDLTAYQAIEARLLQAQKMETMGQFANILAHDFRNYLLAIRGFADLAARDADDETQQKADLDGIAAAVEHATELIENVLAFARPRTSDGDAADVRRTIEGLRPLVQRVVGQRVRVVLDIADRMPCATISPSLLGQVLLNLASNARDAMAGRGTLTVAAEPDGGDGVVLVVRDTGSGMDAAVAARLFDPFYSTKTGDAANASGTGLGLTSVRLIVERAGGTITVDTAVGEGTTFRVSLPAAVSSRSLVGVAG